MQMLGRGVRSIPNRPPTATIVAAADAHEDRHVCAAAATAAAGLGDWSVVVGDVVAMADVPAPAAGGAVGGGVVGEGLARRRGVRSTHVCPPTTSAVAAAHPHDGGAAEHGSCAAAVIMDAVHEVGRGPDHKRAGDQTKSRGRRRHPALPPPAHIYRRPLAQGATAAPPPPVHCGGGRPRPNSFWALPFP